MNARNVAFAVTLLVGLALDQATKLWVAGALVEGVDEIQVIPGLFSLVHRQNPGAAFGMFREWEYRHYLFLGFTVIAGAFIVDLLRKSRAADAFLGATLGLILSGAVGNAIDRVAKQTVTDFLKVYADFEPVRGWLVGAVGTNEWPSFNVADAALVVGVALYLIHQRWFDVPAVAAAPEQTQTGS
ncbi:MAG: signal peptidase II [Myxococcota bacterium]